MKEELAKLCFETLLEFSFFKETDDEGKVFFQVYIWIHIKAD